MNRRDRFNSEGRKSLVQLVVASIGWALVGLFAAVVFMGGIYEYHPLYQDPDSLLTTLQEFMPLILAGIFWVVIVAVIIARSIRYKRSGRLYSLEIRSLAQLITTSVGWALVGLLASWVFLCGLNMYHPLYAEYFEYANIDYLSTGLREFIPMILAGILWFVMVMTIVMWSIVHWRTKLYSPRRKTTWRRYGLALSIVLLAGFAATFECVTRKIARELEEAREIAHPTAVEARIDGPTVSPDGSRVVFATVQESPELCILDLESKELWKIRPPGYILEAFYGMSWSPAGRFIVTTVVEGGWRNPGSWSIWKVNVPSAKWQKIGEVRKGLCQRGLVSPDGNSVLFRDAVRMDLLLVDLQKGRPKYITSTGDVFRLGYDWSPDGSRIYYSRGYIADKGGIWIMNTDGSKKKLMSDKFKPYSLSISSTGKYIAFMVEGGDKNPLFVSRLQEFSPVKISDDCAYIFDLDSDNDRLAYYTDTAIEVWHPSSKQGQEGAVREIAKDGYYPVWAKNGRAILFIRNKMELWEYDVNSGKMERIFSINQ